MPEPAQPRRSQPSPRSGVSSAYPEPMERLITAFNKLPGIGPRSAERLAFHILKSNEAEAAALGKAIADVKRTLKHCAVCFNLCDGDRCGVCLSESRDRSLVLVVEQPKDVIAIEQTGSFRGLYHVLMGRLSPLDGVGPEDLTTSALLARVDHADRNAGGERIAEVILGLNPTLEGDGTALYLQEELAARGVRISRLARGLPAGSELQFASKAVLMDALEGRQHLR